MRFSMQVQGLNELTAKLARIPFAVTQKVVRGAALDGVKEIAKIARRNAAGLTKTPRRTKGRAPGTIARSVVSLSDKKLSGPYTPTAMVWVASGKKYAKKGRDAYYWPWVEMGHRIVPRGPAKLGGVKKRTGIAMRRRNWDGRRVSPYPVLGPAASAGARAAVEKFRDRVGARIDRAMMTA